MNGPYVQGLMCRPRVSEQSVKRKYGGQGRRMDEVWANQILRRSTGRPFVAKTP